mgnify:CR=1 FL=1
MALIVEVQQISDNLFRVTTCQIVEDESNHDFKLLQHTFDENAAEAFRLMEVRDLIRVLLERTQLEPREREVITLFLRGWDFPDIAQRLKVSRQAVNEAFWRAVQRFRQVVAALGINEP